jgi:hypothetical protein
LFPLSQLFEFQVVSFLHSAKGSSRTGRSPPLRQFYVVHTTLDNPGGKTFNLRFFLNVLATPIVELQYMNNKPSNLIDVARPELGRKIQIICDLPIDQVHTLSKNECRAIMVHSNPYRSDVREFKRAVYQRLTQLKAAAAPEAPQFIHATWCNSVPDKNGTNAVYPFACNCKREGRFETWWAQYGDTHGDNKEIERQAWNAGWEEGRARATVAKLAEALRWLADDCDKGEEVNTEHARRRLAEWEANQ